MVPAKPQTPPILSRSSPASRCPPNHFTTIVLGLFCLAGYPYFQGFHSAARLIDWRTLHHLLLRSARRPSSPCLSAAASPPTPLEASAVFDAPTQRPYQPPN